MVECYSGLDPRRGRGPRTFWTLGPVWNARRVDLAYPPPTSQTVLLAPFFDARPAIALPAARLCPPYRARSFIMVQMDARGTNISTQPVLSRERGWYMVRQ